MRRLPKKTRKLSSAYSYPAHEKKSKSGIRSEAKKKKVVYELTQFVSSMDNINNHYFDSKTADNISETDLSSSEKKRYRITRAW